MKYQFYFTGYSDDIVIAGNDTKADTDEHYSTYYRMSNGALVKAEHGPSDDPEHPGWKITCYHPSAKRVVAPGEEEKHTSADVPAWMAARAAKSLPTLPQAEAVIVLEALNVIWGGNPK